MGPMVWWWRWWMGMDPNRDRKTSDVGGMVATHGGESDTASTPTPTPLRTDDDALEQLREEASRLRRQVADLTRSGAEVDGLRAELDQARAEAAELRGALERSQAEIAELRAEVERAQAQAAEMRAERDRVDAELRTELEHTHAETDRLRAELERADAEGAAARGGPADVESAKAAATPTGTPGTDAPPVDSAERSQRSPDASEAASILGSAISLDDLTVVDGVGPKIAALLSDAGVDTWRALAEADIDRLREVLAEAGPRYRMHDPAPWPPQAALLADGRWQEFKDLKDG